MSNKFEMPVEQFAEAVAKENARLRQSLERMLLEFDFLIEAGHLPDIRNDIIFDEARTVLGKNV